MLAPGNPLRLKGINDLARGDVRFVNRNPGSGTRVWIDSQLRKAGIAPGLITGYDHAVATHNEAAALVGGGKADISLGLQAAASIHGLAFIPLFEERYDLDSFFATVARERCSIVQLMPAVMEPILQDPRRRQARCHLRGSSHASRRAGMAGSAFWLRAGPGIGPSLTAPIRGRRR